MISNLKFFFLYNKKLRELLTSLMEKPLTIDDFIILSIIGKGKFAKVAVVKKKDEDNKIYALKIVKKKYIQALKLGKDVMIERNVTHPFIMKLLYSFGNDKKLFFVLQFCQGGEFLGFLISDPLLSEAQAKFYAAQIILALECLHQKNIIYRDLKHSSFLFDPEGYLRLTHSLFSKKVEDTDKPFQKTQEYIAPEIISKQGYRKETDWWCLGIFIYEMMVGYPPFLSQEKEELFDKIQFAHATYPESMSKELKNLLEGLLQKKPNKRLGSKQGAAQIKAHPWFADIDWSSILNKKVRAPFIPHIKKEEDFSQRETKFVINPNYLNQGFIIYDKYDLLSHGTEFTYDRYFF